MTAAPNAAVSMALPPAITPPSTASILNAIYPPSLVAASITNTAAENRASDPSHAVGGR
jgi:hypothetical protein